MWVSDLAGVAVVASVISEYWMSYRAGRWYRPTVALTNTHTLTKNRMKVFIRGNHHNIESELVMLKKHRHVPIHSLSFNFSNHLRLLLVGLSWWIYVTFNFSLSMVVTLNIYKTVRRTLESNPFFLLLYWAWDSRCMTDSGKLLSCPMRSGIM